MRLLLHLYPRRFRERYGDELLGMVEASESRARDGADLVLAAVCLRFGDLSARLGRTGAVVAYGISLSLLVSLSVGAVADDCTAMGTAFGAWTGLVAARAAIGGGETTTEGGLRNA